MKQIDQALKVQQIAQTDPVLFERRFIGSDPWGVQERIARSVWENRTTAVRSCHGSGKSYVAADIAITFLMAFPGAIVLTTAPTGRQVREILWREIRSRNENSRYPLGGEPKTTSWDIAPDWYALGLSTDEPTKFQGYHSEYILLIADEAAGIAESIFEAADGSLNTRFARLLMLGNPTSLAGRFYDSFRNPRVSKIHISCFDTPNFTENGIHTVEDLRAADLSKVKITHPYLITPHWVMEKLEDWGETSPMFQARCLGEFPQQGDDTLIPLNWIELAADKDNYERVEEGDPVHALDPARFGSDKSAFCFRKGDKVMPFETTQKEDTMKTAGRAVDRVMQNPGNLHVEIIGIGSGIFDRIKEEEVRRKLREKGADVYAVNVAEGSTNKDMFVNKRDELFWNLRELFQPKKQPDGSMRPTIGIPKDEELMSQLAAIKFSYTSKGQVKVEKKEEMKKRIGQSPDKADALAISYAPKSRGKAEEIKLGPPADDIYKEEDDIWDPDDE